MGWRLGGGGGLCYLPLLVATTFTETDLLYGFLVNVNWCMVSGLSSTASQGRLLIGEGAKNRNAVARQGPWN